MLISSVPLVSFIEISLLPPPPLVLFDLTPLITAPAGQSEGRHLLGVVDAADDDGLVGIAFEEVDDHFLADARDGDRSPALAGPGLRDADPAGAVLVLLAFAVPVELDLHAAVLVGVDLFAAGSDDDRGLAALHEGLRGDARRTEGRGERDAFESVTVSWLVAAVAAAGATNLITGSMARHVADRGQ